MNLNELVEIQTLAQGWGQFAQALIADGAPPIAPRAGRNNDESHPPIHPTKVWS